MSDKAIGGNGPWLSLNSCHRYRRDVQLPGRPRWFLLLDNKTSNFVVDSDFRESNMRRPMNQV